MICVSQSEASIICVSQSEASIICVSQSEASSLTKDCSVDGLKLLDAVWEGDDLSGADKGEVQGVEIHNNVLTLRSK